MWDKGSPPQFPFAFGAVLNPPGGRGRALKAEGQAGRARAAGAAEHGRKRSPRTPPGTAEAGSPRQPPGATRAVGAGTASREPPEERQPRSGVRERARESGRGLQGTHLSASPRHLVLLLLLGSAVTRAAAGPRRRSALRDGAAPASPGLTAAAARGGGASEAPWPAGRGRGLRARTAPPGPGGTGTAGEGPRGSAAGWVSRGQRARGRPGWLPWDRPSSVVEGGFLPGDGCPRDGSLGTSSAHEADGMRQRLLVLPWVALRSHRHGALRSVRGALRVPQGRQRGPPAAAPRAPEGPGGARWGDSRSRQRAPGPVPPLGAASWSRPPKSFLLPPAHGRRRPSAPAPRLRTAEQRRRPARLEPLQRHRRARPASGGRGGGGPGRGCLSASECGPAPPARSAPGAGTRPRSGARRERSPGCASPRQHLRERGVVSSALREGSSAPLPEIFTRKKCKKEKSLVNFQFKGTILDF